jgi:hypothetical protein
MGHIVNIMQVVVAGRSIFQNPRKQAVKFVWLKFTHWEPVKNALPIKPQLGYLWGLA